MYLIRCKRKKKKLLTWTAAIWIGEMQEYKKGGFPCEVLNKRMPVKGMEAFQTADVGASGWSWGRAVGPLPIGKTEVVYGQGLHRLSRVKKKGSREGREKRNGTWQHFVPGTRRWQSALCRPVLCCDKLVFRCLTAGYEDKVRESKGWRCRVAGISWINQHVLAPSDCPPFLFLAVISSSCTPTQSPHTAHLAGGTGATAPLLCTYVFGLASRAQRRALAKLVPS